jgi:hypothetical protein
VSGPRYQKEPRRLTTEQPNAAERPSARRIARAWRDIRDAKGARATLIKIALVLTLGWLLANAIQQLVILAIVLGALWLILDVVRRNILR